MFAAHPWPHVGVISSTLVTTKQLTNHPCSRSAQVPHVFEAAIGALYVEDKNNEEQGLRNNVLEAKKNVGLLVQQEEKNELL